MASIFGTRPEAVKLAPVISELEAHPGFDCVVVATGQHREMLRQVTDLFGVRLDVDLDIMEPDQSLADVVVRALPRLSGVLDEIKPDLVLVQGDTTTTFTGALAGYYTRRPVAHLEAGLRTHDTYAPYPEEMNRRLTTQLTDLHFAPTATARSHLLDAGVDREGIRVTGNTVIDALMRVSGARLPAIDPITERWIADPRRLVLVTAHRRESWGPGLDRIRDAIDRLARAFRDVRFLVPLHLNPRVRDSLEALGDMPNVDLPPPLNYRSFCHVLRRCHIVLTDSGGIQEEAPALGKPVLVLRDTTERPEGIEQGTARLVGTNPDAIFDAAAELLRNDVAHSAMAQAVNPYGDGRAARRVVEAISHRYRGGAPPEEFQPSQPIQPLEAGAML